MSLYSSGVDFLPRPPRNVFSIGNEATRAILPDFRSVTDLSIFTDRHFDWHIPISSLFIQAIITSAIIFLMVIIVGLVMARRIYEGKFWLIRIIRKPRENVIVPNPIVAFLLMAGIYGLLFTPLFITFCRTFTVTHYGPPRNVLLCFTLPWLPLCYGLIFATVGTYYATPAAVQPIPASYTEEDDDDEEANYDDGMVYRLIRFINRVKIINTSFTLLVLPIIAITVMIVVPSFICNTKWTDALHMERQWQQDYSSMTSFTTSMVQQSQIIWYKQLQAARLCAIIFIIYTIFGFLVGTTYIFVAIRLILTIHEDIARAKKQRHQNDAIQTFNEEHPVQISQIIRDALKANQASRPGSRDGGNGSFTSRQQQQHHHHHQQKQSMSNRSDRTVHEEVPTPKNNENLLKSALLHIYIQAISIGLGTLGFGGIALSFSILIYGKLEQPSLDGNGNLFDNLFENHIGRIWMALMYVSCIFGGLSIFTVAYKTYEPVFHRQVSQGASSTHINFADFKKGFSHIRSTLQESPPSAADINNTIPIFSHSSRSPARNRANTVVNLASCDTIVEEDSRMLKLHPQPRRPQTAPTCRDKDYNEVRETDWSTDASTAASSPASILKQI